MGRFFVKREDIIEDEVVISGGEAKHITEVMRLSQGDQLTLFDGQGGEYSGSIKEIDNVKKTLMVSITAKKNLFIEGTPLITLAQAIPKKNKMDLVVEKATELGVHKIIPILTERTIVRPDTRASSKMIERWKRISVETSKQCARAFVPEISEITFFRDVVALGTGYDLCLLACLNSRTITLKSAIPHPVPLKTLIMIGPEGDFSEKESEYARDRGFFLVSLGKNVLKSDTAGLFVISVIGYEGSC